MKLYHYTSLDSFSKIWISHSLLFSESKRTNDVFESIKILEIGEPRLPYNGEEKGLEVQGHFNKMFWDEVAKYKQISLLTSSLKKHTFYNLLINNILYLCVT